MPSVDCWANPQPQCLAIRPLAGEEGRGSGRTTRTRRGSEGSSEGVRENPGPAAVQVRAVGDGRLGGQQRGAVALGDKSSSTHPSIRGGLWTETGLEWVLERLGSEKMGNGECRQL